MSWTISVPVWGDHYRKVFVERGLPSMLIAATKATLPVRFVLHTDEKGLKELPEVFRKQSAGFAFRYSLPTLELKSVGNKPTYVALQNSHAEAVSMTRPGNFVMLLNADLVVSDNIVEACEHHFLEKNKQAVVCLGIRTVYDPNNPPLIGAPPKVLLDWGWEHRHQIIKDLEWGEGRSALPTNIFFTKTPDHAVVAYGFHLHPVAIRKPHELSFQSTIDGDLLDTFERERIHIVTDPDDLALVEQSVADRRFPIRGNALREREVASAMRTRASKLHLWQFQHRIVVCRARLCDIDPTAPLPVEEVFYDDRAIARNISELMGYRVNHRPPGR